MYEIWSLAHVSKLKVAERRYLKTQDDVTYLELKDFLLLLPCQESMRLFIQIEAYQFKQCNFIEFISNQNYYLLSCLSAFESLLFTFG